MEAENREKLKLARARMAMEAADLLDEGKDAKRPRRESIPDDVKLLIWERDRGQCVKCGSNEKLEFDHIIPLSMGGSNTARNLQLLCERCNREKGGRLV